MPTTAKPPTLTTRIQRAELRLMFASTAGNHAECLRLLWKIRRLARARARNGKAT